MNQAPPDDRCAAAAVLFIYDKPGEPPAEEHVVRCSRAVNHRGDHIASIPAGVDQSRTFVWPPSAKGG